MIDPQQPWTVTREGLHSQGKHTPYLGCELQGRAVGTLVGGRVVHALDAALRG